MIELIYGKKGSGKTKRIIDSANNAAKTTSGYVVFMDDNNRYMYDLERDIRFIATDAYSIKDADDLYTFICGGTAFNYGIEALYIDGLKKIVNAEYDALESFFERLSALSEQNGFKAVLTISADESEMPEFLKKYI